MHHRSRFGQEIPPSPGARGRPLDQSLIGLQRCGRQLALPLILSTRFSLPASPLSPLSPLSPRLRPSHPNHFTARPVFGPYTSAARPTHDCRRTPQSPRTGTALPRFASVALPDPDSTAWARACASLAALRSIEAAGSTSAPAIRALPSLWLLRRRYRSQPCNLRPDRTDLPPHPSEHLFQPLQEPRHPPAEPRSVLEHRHHLAG